jgi:hypothetical protein
MIYSRFLALLVLIGIYSVACAGGVNREIAITAEQLPRMVLTLEQLGSEYVDFEEDDDNGEDDNESTIANATNQDEARKFVEKWGRITGYTTSYTSNSRILGGPGAWSVGTEVELFPSSQNLGAALLAEFDREKKEISGTSEAGQLQSFKSFDPKLGRDSRGILFQILVPGADSGLKRDMPMQFAYVVFTEGPVIGSVFQARFDGKADPNEVKRLAKQLKNQIHMVATTPPLGPDATTP